MRRTNHWGEVRAQVSALTSSEESGPEVRSVHVVPGDHLVHKEIRVEGGCRLGDEVIHLRAHSEAGGVDELRDQHEDHSLERGAVQDNGDDMHEGQVQHQPQRHTPAVEVPCAGEGHHVVVGQTHHAKNSSAAVSQQLEDITPEH